jgi:hypothetical protein
MREPLSQGVELGQVAGRHIADAGIIGLDPLVRRSHRDRLQRHVIGGEEVGQVVDGRCAAEHADGCAIEVERRGDAHRARRHEALPVVIGDAHERELVADLPPHGPGRVARQHVDLAVLQRLKARLGGQGNEPDVAGVAEDRRGERAAEIHVEARPLAALVEVGESRQALVDAAQQRAPRLDRLKRLGRGEGCDKNKRDRRETGAKAAPKRHSDPPAHAHFARQVPERRQISGKAGRLPAGNATSRPPLRGIAARLYSRGGRNRGVNAHGRE